MDYESVSVYQRRVRAWVTAIVAVTAALAALLVFDLLASDGSNDVTRGMSGDEVVRLFYGSVDTADLHTIRNCVNTRAVTMLNNRIFSAVYAEKFQGLEEYTHAVNLSVTDGEVRKMTPREWIERGRPFLESDTRVYGVAGLTVTDLGDGRYRAEYDLYNTRRFDRDSAPGMPDIVSCMDVLTLEESKTGWIIGNVQQVSETRVEAGGVGGTETVLPDSGAGRSGA